MILEAIRSLTDFLKDPTYGINAELSALTLEDGDPAPPSIAAVLDPTRNLIEGALDWPILTVTQDGGAEADGEVSTVKRDATVSLVIRYVTADPDPERTVTDTLLTLRALSRALRTYLDNTHIADRTRNGVCVLTCRRMAYGPVEEEAQGGVTTGAMLLDFLVRDEQP